MDEKEEWKEQDDPEAIPGIITKTAEVKPLEVTQDDLKKINQYTLSPLKEEDVFIFKAIMADNEQDDRNYAPFNLKALQDLKKLYPGKTMLKDHYRLADKQIARVFDTELVQSSKKVTELGEVHTELIAKIYMLKTDSNKDLIADIKGGIKKEVSTSCRPDKMICNICNTDNMKKFCIHYPGREYTIQDGTATGTKKRCKMLISGAKEAFELSFVAIPAQPRAGTHKCIGFAKPILEDTEEIEEEKKESEMKDKIVKTELDMMLSFFNAQTMEEEE